jgi:hypothetical protein
MHHRVLVGHVLVAAEADGAFELLEVVEAAAGVLVAGAALVLGVRLVDVRDRNRDAAGALGSELVFGTGGGGVGVGHPVEEEAQDLVALLARAAGENGE